jgi:N-methylhydantoinase B
MNNLSIGGWDSRTGAPFTYYETVAGGAGASPAGPGTDGVHTHMTNSMNTPVEALETAYPVRVMEYSLRRRSGGSGHHRGGSGVVRSLELLEPCRVNMLSDRRYHPPPGLAGGEPGRTGVNLVRRKGKNRRMPGKFQIAAEPGDIITIKTPGGGGWGKKK